ncbi:hypothetical protein ACQP2X_16580 [Actinoplanes sp. CA-131856]
MTSYVLAAFAVAKRWVPPSQPRAEVVTVSDCLAELLPFGDDPLIAPWHPIQPDVTPTAGHVLAVSVPASQAGDVAGMVEGWIGDYPHPMLVNLARGTPPPAGRTLGFEVLGFEAGRFHSWLCYGLREQATNEYGLLTSLAAARQVADRANSARGTVDGTPEEVTWFPARITGY